MLVGVGVMVTVGDAICAMVGDPPSRLAIIMARYPATSASFRKLRDDAPVMLRDTGAYCLRQTPALTRKAGALAAFGLSLLTMNCSSVSEESATNEISVASVNVRVAGW